MRLITERESDTESEKERERERERARARVRERERVRGGALYPSWQLRGKQLKPSSKPRSDQEPIPDSPLRAMPFDAQG